MPELPEVETIRLGLQRKILGLEIQKVEVLTPKSFQSIDGKPFDYAQGLRGRKVLKVWRKAKILGVELIGSKQGTVDSGQNKTVTSNLQPVTLLFHFKMTGQLIWVGNQNSKGKSQKLKLKIKSGERFIGGHPTLDMVGPLPNRSTRVILTFNDNSKLYFNDQRRFGWMRVVTSTEVTSNKLFEKLGPEPLEKGFTWQTLKQNLLRHKSLPVKVALMDQSVVSGVGNIYANEACFNAKLDPRIKVGEMTDTQFRSLHQGMIKSLRDGIKYGGSSRAHFVDTEGHKGYFLDYAFVYGRDKHSCKVCGTEIKKIQLRGRGTYFCPTCQMVKI